MGRRAVVPPTLGESRVRLDRFSVPEQLPGATAFSDDPDLYSIKQLLAFINSSAWLWRPLVERTEQRYEWGPKRGPGKWALAYLAFVMSGIADVEPWFNKHAREDLTLWKLCGFTRIPAYQTIWERFAELEEHAEAFERAAATSIQRARSKDPRVGAWWHVDATEAETHAAPKHDCLPSDPCPTRRRTHMPRLATGLVRELRQAGDEQPLEVDGEAEEVVVAGTKSEPIVRRVFDEERGGVRFLSGGHWWFSRDLTAGTRSYTSGGRSKRAWHGFYNAKMVDHYTGAPLTIYVFAADTQERDSYPMLYERARRNLGGDDPFAVAGDRGNSCPEVCEHNTRRGVASVFPYRRANGSAPKRPPATDEWDEHGIPLCKHCGSGGDFVRFSAADGRARLWFQCSMPQSAACDRVQTISCSKEWTRLLPVWRTEELYASMRETHGEYERAHHLARVRYLVGPDTLANRPKRIGAPCQQLRSSAALLLEWLRISRRHGWLGRGARRASPRPQPSRWIASGIAHRRAKNGRTGGGRAIHTRPRARGQPPPVLSWQQSSADDYPF
jgi:hypothetical protein